MSSKKKSILSKFPIVSNFKNIIGNIPIPEISKYPDSSNQIKQDVLPQESTKPLVSGYLNALKVYTGSSSSRNGTETCEVTIPNTAEILKIQVYQKWNGLGGVSGSNTKFYLNNNLISDYLDDENWSSLGAGAIYNYETLAYNGLKLENKENKIKFSVNVDYTTAGAGNFEITIYVTAFA